MSLVILYSLPVLIQVFFKVKCGDFMENKNKNCSIKDCCSHCSMYNTCPFAKKKLETQKEKEKMDKEKN